MKYTAIIRDAEAGNEIARFKTVEEARAELQKFKEKDKEEGIFEEGFYEIYKSMSSRISPEQASQSQASCQRR